MKENNTCKIERQTRIYILFKKQLNKIMSQTQKISCRKKKVARDRVFHILCSYCSRRRMMLAYIFYTAVLQHELARRPKSLPLNSSLTRVHSSIIFLHIMRLIRLLLRHEEKQRRRRHSSSSSSIIVSTRECARDTHTHGTIETVMFALLYLIYLLTHTQTQKRASNRL